MRIAVAGGTGVVGVHVVSALEQAGHEAVVLSRSSGVDLETGTGLDDALAGVGGVIDVSNVATQSRRRSVEFFTSATVNLLAAGARAGVRHHAVLSIVGSDRVDLGYYAGKREQERLTEAGPLPWSILRATQFHEFAGQVLDQVPGPVAVVPRMRTQPVAASDVGAALASLVVGPPVGRAVELAGPREEHLPDMARRLLAARGSRRKVVAVRLPARGGAAMAAGGLLPGPDARLSRLTFDEWLAAAPR